MKIMDDSYFKGFHLRGALEYSINKYAVSIENSNQISILDRA
jgi:hypothetical protein